MKRPARFVALVLGLGLALSASAQIYQWKDKEGRTHFSDRPPPPNQTGVQARTPKRAQPPAVVTEPETDETGATEKGESGTEPKNAAAAAPASVPVQEKSQAAQRDEEFRKRRAAAAEAREKAEKDAARVAQREQDCQRARAQYATLNSGQRIARPTEGGGRKFLDEEERAAEIARTERLVESFCDKD